jgi:hypothetical protein
MQGLWVKQIKEKKARKGGKSMKTKSKSNFIIDAVMFLCMMALTGTGFLRKYILLGGRASRETYGAKLDMYMLGFNRDDWGTIHLYMGYFLLALLVLHIVLHWKQIKIMFRQLISGDSMRLIITVVFLLISIFLVIFPFVLSPQL